MPAKEDLNIDNNIVLPQTSTDSSVLDLNVHNNNSVENNTVLPQAEGYQDESTHNEVDIESRDKGDSTLNGNNMDVPDKGDSTPNGNDMHIPDKEDSNQNGRQSRFQQTGHIQRGKSASNNKEMEFTINDCFTNRPRCYD